MPSSVRKILLMAVLSVVAMFTASEALAQSAPTGQCNGDLSPHGSWALTPDSGPAGTSAVLAGSFELAPTGAVDGGSLVEGPLVQVWWMETGAGDMQLLAELPSQWDEISTAIVNGYILIPGGASPGAHNVAITVAGGDDPDCVVFTVTESVQQSAYTQTATSLPSTGLLMLLPPGGAAAAVSGALFIRRAR